MAIDLSTPLAGIYNVTRGLGGWEDDVLELVELKTGDAGLVVVKTITDAWRRKRITRRGGEKQYKIKFIDIAGDFNKQGITGMFMRGLYYRIIDWEPPETETRKWIFYTGLTGEKKRKAIAPEGFTVETVFGEPTVEAV
jgi:hypothetical protein